VPLWEVRNPDSLLLGGVDELGDLLRVIRWSDLRVLVGDPKGTPNCFAAAPFGSASRVKVSFWATRKRSCVAAPSPLMPTTSTPFAASFSIAPLKALAWAVQPGVKSPG
jgi:hypothetical protein